MVNYRLYFVKTEKRFAFQQEDRFLVENARKLCGFLKNKIPTSARKFEVIEREELPLSKDEDLFIDIRFSFVMGEKLVKAIKRDLSIVDGTGVVLFEKGTENLTIAESLSNPYSVYKSLMGGMKKYIAPTAKLLPGATVVGNSHIGERCLIGNNTLVRNSYIDDGAVIGYNTEVSRSYVGRKTTLHTNFIGNSIIGDNCHFGYIACTTTLRLDGTKVPILDGVNTYPTDSDKVGSFIESNCNIGAYVALMPGSYVGRGTMIRPYTSVKGFIPRNSYCRSRFRTEIVPNKLNQNIQNRYKILSKKLREELLRNYPEKDKK